MLMALTRRSEWRYIRRIGAWPYAPLWRSYGSYFRGLTRSPFDRYLEWPYNRGIMLCPYNRSS